jgi:MinD-like ATPase involved in chromosome partitioning or flagellar assembly
MSDFVKLTNGTDKDCLQNGLTVIAGGTGIADMKLGAPSPGYRAVIRVGSLTSGTVVVTTPAGITLDGTNNTATFNAVEDVIALVYNTPTAWAVESNVSVALSSV